MVAQTGVERGLSSWARIDGVQMHYATAGSGPPLLLLHGLLGGSFCWRLNIADLSISRTIYALDLPGSGLSYAPRRQDCGMQAQVRQVEEFIKSAGIESVDIVACSWGGAIALLLAAGSTAVRSLVLAAPVNPWSELGLGRVRFCSSTFGSLLVRCALPFSARFHEIGLERMYGDPARIRPGTLDGYSAELQQRGRARSLISTLRRWEDDLAVLRQAIPRIQAPTLLIWGSKDGAVDPRSAEPLRNSLAHCRLEMLPGVGHLPFEEAPEVFNRLVLDFIEKPV